jgi:hypothetical protein
VRFRSSSTPLPWASSMTRFQNAQQSFQNRLQSGAQGLSFISRQKIKQSTTCSLCSKPSQRRKRPQDSCHLLSRRETRPLLEVFTKRFTGGRNSVPMNGPTCSVESHAEGYQWTQWTTIWILLRGVDLQVPRVMRTFGYTTIQDVQLNSPNLSVLHSVVVVNE